MDPAFSRLRFLECAVRESSTSAHETSFLFWRKRGLFSWEESSAEMDEKTKNTHTHTCLIEARLYVNAVCCFSHAWQRKSAGSATGIFWNSHEKPAYLNSLIFGRKQEGSTVIAKQVQVVDQTTLPPKCHSFVGLDRQIGSSPPACLLACELSFRCDIVWLFGTECDTHTHTQKHQRSSGFRHRPWPKIKSSKQAWSEFSPRRSSSVGFFHSDHEQAWKNAPSTGQEYLSSSSFHRPNMQSKLNPERYASVRFWGASLRLAWFPHKIYTVFHMVSLVVEGLN